MPDTRQPYHLERPMSVDDVDAVSCVLPDGFVPVRYITQAEAADLFPSFYGEGA